jgi:hypothetical protein
MWNAWRKLKQHWGRTDTIVLSGNLFALGLFVGNCWWESVSVCYAACGVPLGFQGFWGLCGKRSRTGLVEPSESDSARALLLRSLILGGVVGWLWPLGEWLVVNVLGWWGQYLAPGIRILETPIYCILIGWLASAYCAYVAGRALQMGFGVMHAAMASGVTALGLGALGENLFVAAKMWTYDASSWDWGAVPAFVPIAYGLSYAMVPLWRRLHAVTAALLFTGVMLALTVLTGVLAGFFPRP